MSTILADVGQYKAMQMTYIVRMYEKIGACYDISILQKMSRKDMRDESARCRELLGITARNGKLRGKRI